MEITEGKGLPVVYDGVGKSTFEKSVKCLKTRGMMISFGNASGSLENIDVKKSIQPKGLYFTRPAMGHYLSTNYEMQEGADKLFKNISLGKIRIEIFKKYRLDDVVQAHKDLESRKIIGPAIIIP
jgi:NADPH2:quinone reductase